MKNCMDKEPKYPCYFTRLVFNRLHNFLGKNTPFRMGNAFQLRSFWNRNLFPSFTGNEGLECPKDFRFQTERGVSVIHSSVQHVPPNDQIWSPPSSEMKTSISVVYS